MTFNSRLAKFAEKLAEETFPLKMYIDESLPKLAHSSFTLGALNPTIEAAVRADERAKVYRKAEEFLSKGSTDEAISYSDSFEKLSIEAESELQRLLSEGGEN